MHDGSTRRATYDDLLAAPPAYKAELIFGELILQPQPKARHQAGLSALGMVIGPPFQRGVGGAGGWWIVYGPELHLGDDVVVPDFGGWRRERLPDLPEGHVFEVAPDWVCEVLSPSTTMRDRNEKADIYAAAGVRHYWIIDPDSPLLEAFENQDGRWLRLKAFGPDDSVTAPPFGEVPFVLKTLWE